MKYRGYECLFGDNDGSHKKKKLMKPVVCLLLPMKTRRRASTGNCNSTCRYVPRFVSETIVVLVCVRLYAEKEQKKNEEKRSKSVHK